MQKKTEPIFTVCCQQGKIKLPSSKPTPDILDSLLDPSGGQISLSFWENIRAYKSMFSFTTLGAKANHSINDGSSPYIFKISGQVCHLMILFYMLIMRLLNLLNYMFMTHIMKCKII